MFREKLSGPFSRVKKFEKKIKKSKMKVFVLDFLTLEDGTRSLFRNVSQNYHSTLRNIPEDIAAEA
jgi:hypothetical protein